MGEAIPDRTVLQVSGTDREVFLQGLVTNDLRKLKSGAVYAALLSPQGKYLADFFLLDAGESILLDVATVLSDGLMRRLTMYKLRANVQIQQTKMTVSRGLSVPPVGAVSDPRHPALGWRCYGSKVGGPQLTDWTSLRVAYLVPETGIELVPDETYILEAGFERLNGVDFRKGCYVGQEVTARMKHKTELRKGLAKVSVDGPAPLGSTIFSDDKEAGRLLSRSGNRAIAYLRFDRATERMKAGDAVIGLVE